MKTFWLLFISALLSIGTAAAQDCQFTWSTTTAVSQSPAVSNRPTTAGGQAGCSAWVFKYWTNTSSATSIQIEGAADAVSGGVHGPTGSYTLLTVASPTGSGANPATGAAEGGAALCCDYYPWIRFTVNTLTSSGAGTTLTVRAYGYRNNQAVNGGGGGAPTVVHSFGASFVNAGAALASGVNPAYFTVPYACTIQAWNIAVSPADTATIDIWRLATGTAIPTVSNTITASAVPAISTGTAVHSTVTTGWCGTGTCAIAANDIIGINLKAVGGTATFANLTVQCQ